MQQTETSEISLIGQFHQNIINNIDTKWQVSHKGFHLINEEDKIYVDIKKKHYTMNSESSRMSYIMMQSELLKDSNVNCILVEVMAKKTQNIPWKISVNKQSFEHAHIRRVSIVKFYEIVTGDTFAFRKLCQVLPIVLDDVLSSMEVGMMEKSILKKLQVIAPNLLQSFYPSSFIHYDGFESLNI